MRKVHDTITLVSLIWLAIIATLSALPCYANGALIPPVACFTVSNDQPNVCETVTFDATCSYDPDGIIVKYEWDLDGDCTYETDTGDDPIVIYHYDTNGTCTVKLRVTDNDGLTDETSITILVRGHPVADFTWNPPSPQVCETITFDASASTPDGGVIISWDWDFNDTTTGSGEIVTHHYNRCEDYYVTLTVTDNETKSDSITKKIRISTCARALEVVDFYPSDRWGNFRWYFEIGSKIHFNLTLRNLICGPKNVSISVHLSDGLLDPIGGEFFDTTIPSNASECYLINLTVPLWAHVGKGIAYANIFLEETGPIGPENTTNFYIWGECTEVTVHVQDLWGNPVFAQVSIHDGGRIVAKGYTDDLGNFNTSLIPGEYAAKATNEMGSNSSTHHFNVPHTTYVVTVFSPDVNRDGIVDVQDVVIAALAFRSKPEDPNWNPYADLNQDGVINIIDLVMIAIHFDETW